MLPVRSDTVNGNRCSRFAATFRQPPFAGKAVSGPLIVRPRAGDAAAWPQRRGPSFRRVPRMRVRGGPVSLPQPRPCSRRPRSALAPLRVAGRRVMLSGVSPRSLALLLATFVATALAGDAPRPLPRPVQIHDFETLTHADATRLAGRPALYRIVKDSLAEEYEGRTLIDCASADTVHRTARLLPRGLAAPSSRRRGRSGPRCACCTTARAT